MTEGDLLERLDRHTERMGEHIAVANDHMAATREHMAQGNQLMARVEEEMRLSRKDRADGRAFLHDLNLRQERITEELVEHIGGQTEILRDLHAETLAQRKSIWRVHDKLDELGGGPAGAAG